MDELSRVARRLSRAELEILDRAIGWLIIELRAIYAQDRTAAERETLAELERLRARLPKRADP